MRWSVTIPGQPVSWDAAYRTGKVYLKADASGARRSIHRPVKTDEAAKYQNDVILLTRAARPSSWATPAAQVRVCVELYLVNDIDCDNATKLAFDAAAKAIGCNDKLFVPCYRKKVIGVPPQAARVVLTFDDDLDVHADPAGRTDGVDGLQRRPVRHLLGPGGGA